MANSDVEGPTDALDLIGSQDDTIADLLTTWRDATEKLRHGDDVHTRWNRGSAVKLLLQHLAVRESAKEAVAGRLRDVGRQDLSDLVEGDGVGRREAIDQLDELARGHEAITLNTPAIDRSIEELGARFDRERGQEAGGLLSQVAEVLGPPGERDLPSPRHVRMHSSTHPSPVPRWYDRIGPVKALKSLYDSLRSSPSGGTSPTVDEGREGTPGVRG